MQGLQRTASAVLTSADPRETMCVLPSYLQALLTALTAKPYVGEAPHSRSPWFHLSTAGTVLLLGVTLSSVASVLQGFWLLALVPGWGLTVAGARKLQVQIVHQAAHEAFTGQPRLDAWVGTVLSIGLTIGSFATYKRTHRRDHHAQLMTTADPTLKFLTDLMGLQPGMPPAQLWRQFWRTLWSPRFHARFLAARLRGHWRDATPDHVLATAAALGLGLGIVAWTGAWGSLLLAWVLPMTVLYQVSACIRLCVEHHWSPAQAGATPTGKEAYAALTCAIFLGEAVPSSTLPTRRRLGAWLRWWGRLCCIHLPARVLVMVGDTPVHDYHHRHPTSPQWTNAAFARQQDLDAGCPGGWPCYTAVWGLHQALDAAFTSLSLAARIPSPTA